MRALAKAPPCFGSKRLPRRRRAAPPATQRLSFRISTLATRLTATRILAAESRSSIGDREGVRTFRVMCIDTYDRPLDRVVAGLQRADLNRQLPPIVADLWRSHGLVRAVGACHLQLREQFLYRSVEADHDLGRRRSDFLSC